jgi:uncharacterized FlaG/YvyC family protein
MEISGLQRIDMAWTTPASPTPPVQSASSRTLIKAVKAVNQSEALGTDRELVFRMDRESNRPVIEIVDRNTREVIQQVPTEYLLRVTQELGKSDLGTTDYVE